jgi:hypothetical protein
VSFIDTKNGLSDRFSLPAVLVQNKSTHLPTQLSTGFQAGPFSLYDNKD